MNGTEPLKSLTIIIPVRNEEDSIVPTILALENKLRSHNIDFQILIIDDGSQDQTFRRAQELGIKEVEIKRNTRSPGFGNAIATGLEAFKNDAVLMYMADGSDSPQDVITYWYELQKGYDCVFGSRFIPGSKVQNYPKPKLALNRLANLFIQILFRIELNDTTNAFKAYRKTTIQGLQPILSHHFNITVELPLKAITRGYSYSIVPISWIERKEGKSKLKIKEMGSRYLFICLYIWIEKHLSKGDYKKLNHYQK